MKRLIWSFTTIALIAVSVLAVLFSRSSDNSLLPVSENALSQVQPVDNKHPSKVLSHTEGTLPTEVTQALKDYDDAWCAPPRA